jgi:hypothetical protein
MKNIFMVFCILFTCSLSYSMEKQPRSDNGFSDTPAVEGVPVDKVSGVPESAEVSPPDVVEPTEVYGPVSATPSDNLDEICVGETARQYLPCIRRATPNAYREPSESGRPCGSGYSLVSGPVGNTVGSLNVTRWHTVPEGARQADISRFVNGSRGSPRATGLQGCIQTNFLNGGN